MKNSIVAVLVIVLAVVIAGILALTIFTITLPSQTEEIDETGQEITITGVVYENIQEVPVDGNNILMVDSDDGRRMVLYQEGGRVPIEVQADQCNKNPLIAQLAQTINAGDRVEVFGAINVEGNIEVCSSTDYTINVITSTGDPEMQETRQVAGEVVELISDCAFDGNCAYVIETQNGDRVTVIWAEGMSMICQNDPFNGGNTDINVGDTIDALGRVITARTISGCGDPSYFITKTS